MVVDSSTLGDERDRNRLISERGRQARWQGSISGYFSGASFFRRSVPRKRGTRRLSISKCPGSFHSRCLMSRNSTRRGKHLHKRSGRILGVTGAAEIEANFGTEGEGEGERSTNWSVLIGEYISFTINFSWKNLFFFLFNFLVVLMEIISIKSLYRYLETREICATCEIMRKTFQLLFYFITCITRENVQFYG